MKVGSLVECVKSKTEDIPKWIINPKPPVVGETYTVSEIIDCPVSGNVCVRVEEQVFGYNQSMEEMAVPVECFRELQPPINLSFINELQNQLA